jgi:competence protein ComEC
MFPFILAGSFVTAVAGALSDDLGVVAGQVAYVPLRWLVLVGRIGADIPGASLELGRVGVIEALLLCGLVGAIVIYISRLTPRDAYEEPVRALRIRPLPGAAALIVLATLFLWWGALFDGGTDGLTATVLDVGQGDAILIETPAGHRILVDGGPSGARLAQALGEALPAGARRFDLVVLTHGQDDHVTGLVPLLDRYDVRAVLMSAQPGTSGAYHAWVDALASSSIPVHEAVAGEYVDLGGGARIEVLGPPAGLLGGTSDDLNNNSVVLRLVYGEVSFLLTGDIEAEAEASLLEQGGPLRATVLKAGHHGSDGSSTPAFLAAVQPSVAVISAGAENTFGHPSPTTRLRFAGVPLFRTDLNGHVRFETDGRRLWAEPARGEVELLSPSIAAGF